MPQQRTDERPERYLAYAVTLIAIVPLITAAWRAATGDWLPIADDAYFTVRSRDVFTSHHPLLGAWSSGSVELADPINNLGPLQLDLLAPFTRWTPWGGTAVGVVAVHMAAIVTIAWLVDRLLGAKAVVVAMIPVGIMMWTMGSEALITARQHPYLMLPYLVVLVATWAAAAGNARALLPLVFFGSLCVQTHLSYPVLVAPLLVVAGIGLGRRWRVEAEARPELRRFTAYAVVLGVVLWSQTVIDQLFGRGNLTAVLGTGGSGEGQPAAGFELGARIMAGVLTTPDHWGRHGFSSYNPNNWLPSDARIVALVLLLVAVAAIGVGFAATGRRLAASGTATFLVAVLAGLIDAAMLPVTLFGTPIGNYRWLWALLAFGSVLLLMLFLAGAERVAERFATARLAILVPLSVAVLFLTVSNVPRSVTEQRADHYDSRTDLVLQLTTSLDAWLDATDTPSTILLDDTKLYFGHPFTYPLMAVLQAHDIEIKLASQIHGYRFGDERVADGSEPARLTIWNDEFARQRRDDAVAMGENVGFVVITYETTGTP